MRNTSEDTSNNQERLITRRELAKLCNVSTRTIDNWVAADSIPVLRGPSERCVRFLWSDVLNSLRATNQTKAN